MTFSIDNPEGGCNNPPLGKYVWEKPSGEQGLSITLVISTRSLVMPKVCPLQNFITFVAICFNFFIFFFCNLALFTVGCICAFAEYCKKLNV